MNDKKVVDGFIYLPPSLRAWIGRDIPDKPFEGYIPWTPLKKPVCRTTFSLMTSAGISMKGDPPFDMEREKHEPMWGDPTVRKIPVTARQTDIAVNHLHINTEYILKDINVILPLARFQEFAAQGIIGRLAPTAYSYYGYQPDPAELLDKAMPKVTAGMKEEGVEAVLLTPA